jgi:putative spermidine/putrescine transport system permease protein
MTTGAARPTASRARLPRPTVPAVLTWMGTGGFLLGLLGAVVAVLLASLATRWLGTWLPAGYTGQWYHSAWTDYGVQGLLVSTFEVALTVVLASLLIAVPTAYVLARLTFPGKSLMFLLFLLPQVIPPMTYGIPLATVMYKFHLAETLAGVVLVNMVPSVPFAILVLVPFVEQIDPRVEQAARVCGAGMLQVLRRVLVPLMVPGLLAAGVLVLVRVVGMFELTFLVAGPQNQTLVVALFYAAAAPGVKAPQEIDAMAVMYMLTTLVLLLVALRFVDPASVVARRSRAR